MRGLDQISDLGHPFRKRQREYTETTFGNADKYFDNNHITNRFVLNVHLVQETLLTRMLLCLTMM